MPKRMLLYYCLKCDVGHHQLLRKTCLENGIVLLTRKRTILRSSAVQRSILSCSITASFMSTPLIIRSLGHHQRMKSYVYRGGIISLRLTAFSVGTEFSASEEEHARRFPCVGSSQGCECSIAAPRHATYRSSTGSACLGSLPIELCCRIAISLSLL